MTEAEVDRINIQLENLGESVKELKDLILREISDLKGEQIAYAFKEIERVQNDQGRAWDAIRALEADRNRAHGGGRVLYAILIAVGGVLTSSAAAVFLTRFFK